MHLILFTNEFPDDEVAYNLRRLHSHAKTGSHAYLADFFRQATYAIRDEIRQLCHIDQALVPHIESIADLCGQTKLRKSCLAGSIDGVLLVVLELGCFIGHFENYPTSYDLSAGKCSLIGLGIGLLVAAAISMSPTLAHLPSAGVEAVRCAFRLGIMVDDMSQNLETRSLDGAQNSWAYVVTGRTQHEVQKELDKLNKGIAEVSTLFISASNSGSITVSGPPSRLRLAFRESDGLRYSKFAALPVFNGLCHAPHIYTSEHICRVLDTSSIRNLGQTHAPFVPVLSTESGNPFEMLSSYQLFEDVLLEILTRPIHVDRFTSAAINQLTASDTGTGNTILTCSATKHPFVDLLSRLEEVPIKVSSSNVLSWINSDQMSNSRMKNPSESPIAIVGMACRYPGGANDLESFWELLESGRDVHGKIPSDRFDVNSHYDPTGKKINSTLTPYGCFIDEPGLFDASFFNMSAREALETDPMHRLALVTAYEALERAGYVPNRTLASDVKRVGSFYGQASDDYREVNTAQDIGTYFIPGGCRAFAPGRISYFFGFWGPSFSCDTACSSSLATVQQACTSLWAGDADTIVAGGLNILTNSDAFAGLGRGHFLSSTGNCKTWDSNADGYCRADGVGSIVLKRLEDAEADNDNILGVILAAATNHSGDAVSITHPHSDAQAELFTKVATRAGIDPLDVSYVEFHGTGTQAGDATEMESVLNVFAPTRHKRGPKQPLYIGAVKSNIGHGEAAAGVTALIKVLCMLQNDIIPPHIGIKNIINPALPKNLSENRNVHIPLEKTCWSQQSQGKRLAIVNNFSAAGGNTTILLEEAPSRPAIRSKDSREYYVIAISAKSRPSLTGNINSLISYLESHHDVSLADLSYTTCSRRIHHPLRVAVSVSSSDELQQRLLRSLDSVKSLSLTTSRAPPPIAFAFAGQGSMYIGAGRELYQSYPDFASKIKQYDYLCQLHSFPPIITIIDGSATQTVTPVASSLAIVCVAMALAHVWRLLGIQPSVVIGHSLGEFAALHVAGILSASDAIYLAGTRAQLASRACEMGSHSMLAIRASTDQIESCLKNMRFEYACRNSEVETVLAGNKVEMAAARDCLHEQGYKCHELDVPFAYHSAQMDPILDEFERLAQKAMFRAPNIPVISPLLSSVVFDAKTFNAKYLRNAMRQPVEFMAALGAAQQMSLIDASTAWVDIGAHPICSGFIRRSSLSSNVVVSSMNRKEHNWATLSNSCAVLHSAGFVIDWSQYNRPFEAELQLLDLPKYNWNNKTYWIQYNGTWALTKGNESSKTEPSPVVNSRLHTSSVHLVLHEEIRKPWEGFLLVESDVMQPQFLEAAWGHKMNRCAVVTSSIHADIAFTIAKFMHDRLEAKGPCHMNITRLKVLQGLVANSDTSVPQTINIKATTDLRSSNTQLHWYNAQDETHFASATVEYGNNEAWLSEWDRVAHLVVSRIENLERMGNDGIASKLSRNMVYRLFANLVDYADSYRGMQSVIIHDLEAVADIKLIEESKGVWTIPPHFIDSVCHLAGFIMNGGDALDTQDHFYVTPGWESMRFAFPLVPGSEYRSYTKMRPTNPGYWVGDVYILQSSRIVGMVGGIIFRRFPRSLLPSLFSPPDTRMSTPSATKEMTARIPMATVGKAPAVEQRPNKSKDNLIHTPSTEISDNAAAFNLAFKAPQIDGNESTTMQAQPTTAKTPKIHPSSLVDQAMAIIAREAVIHSPEELADDVSFVNLGIDSLLSLVLAEKFREELGINLTGTQFLECPTVGEFKVWIEEHC